MGTTEKQKKNQFESLGTGGLAGTQVQSVIAESSNDSDLPSVP